MGLWCFLLYGFLVVGLALKQTGYVVVVGIAARYVSFSLVFLELLWRICFFVSFVTVVLSWRCGFLYGLSRVINLDGAGIWSVLSVANFLLFC